MHFRHTTIPDVENFLFFGIKTPSQSNLLPPHRVSTFTSQLHSIRTYKKTQQILCVIVLKTAQ